MICRPGMYNLQTRTSTFPDHEKLQEKLNIRYLKTLKTKKLNTKNPRIKHCPCSKYVMIYGTDLYNLQTRTKTELAKIVQIELLINSNTKRSQI